MENTNKQEFLDYDKSKSYWENVDANNSGMLGNLSYINGSDIQASDQFLKQLFKLHPGPLKNRCLDCGSGIGRISKNLLVHNFKTVDLMEQDTRFCEKAKESLSKTGQLGKIYNVGLQDFNENESENEEKWDIIWIQWVLIYLSDIDLIEFFKKIANGLNKNGVIVVKENYTKADEVIYDEADSSITRPLKVFKEIFKKSNLRIVKEMKQNHFPKDLFPVYMFALRPIIK